MCLETRVVGTCLRIKCNSYIHGLRLKDETSFTKHTQETISLIIKWSLCQYDINFSTILIVQILEHCLLDLSTSSHLSYVPTLNLIENVFNVLQTQHQIPLLFVFNLMKQSLAILKEIFPISAAFSQVFGAIVNCLFHPFVLSNESNSHSLQEVFFHSPRRFFIISFTVTLNNYRKYELN